MRCRWTPSKRPAKVTVGKRPRTSWRTWLAVAALVIFVALGLLEWRSQVNQTNEGPVEVVKVKLRDMMRRYSSPSPSANSADANAAKPAMQVEEQPKSQTQEPTSASPTAPSATSTNAPPATSDAAAGTSAATSQQNPTPPAGTSRPCRTENYRSCDQLFANRDTSGKWAEGRPAGANAAARNSEGGDCAQPHRWGPTRD